MVPKKRRTDGAKSETALIEVAQILKPIGLHGQLKIYSLTRKPGDLGKYRKFIIPQKDGANKVLEVAENRFKAKFAAIKFKDIDTIEEAERYVGCSLYLEENQLPDLNEDEFYIRDLIGLEVYTAEGGRMGVLTNVLELPANDVYQVTDGERELLIPAVKDFIKQIDIGNHKMIVNSVEGLD